MADSRLVTARVVYIWAVDTRCNMETITDKSLTRPFRRCLFWLFLQSLLLTTVQSTFSSIFFQAQSFTRYRVVAL